MLASKKTLHRRYDPVHRQAYVAWDRQLNKNYNDLMRRLKPGEPAALKAAQVQWLRYRDSEFKFIDTVYARSRVRCNLPMRISERLEIVKKRALALRVTSNFWKKGRPEDSIGKCIRPQDESPLIFHIGGFLFCVAVCAG